MENLMVSLSVVFPLFLMMLVGYAVRSFKIADEATLRKVNTLIFKVFMPLLICRNIYTSDFRSAFSARLLIFSVSITLAVFFIATAVIVRIEKENRKRGVLIQAIFRSNFVLFGIPVITTLYGEDQTAVAAIAISVMIPLFNVLAVIILEVFRGGKPNPAKILKGIVTNPLIISSAIGLIFIALDWQPPELIDSAVKSLGNVATPLAFVVLGGLFNFSSIRGGIKQICIGVGTRLLLYPLIALPLAVLCGLRGAELVVVMVICGAPPAVNSFTMAQQMGGDSELAGSLVIIGSILSVFTIFMWTFLLKTFGLI